VSFGVHRINHLFHHAVCGYHHCDPAGIGFARSTAGPKSHPKNPLRVTQKWEIEIKLLGKGPIVLDRIKAHTKDFDLLVSIAVFSVAKLATFNGSARRGCFRVEPKQDTAAA
jgi:hypothetical protein